MSGLDRNTMRKELLEVYSAYLKNPSDSRVMSDARRLHQQYGGSGKDVDRYMRLTISLLVNIGWNLPSPPKPTREDIEALVVALATRKA